LSGDIPKLCPPTGGLNCSGMVTGERYKDGEGGGDKADRRERSGVEVKKLEIICLKKIIIQNIFKNYSMLFQIRYHSHSLQCLIVDDFSCIDILHRHSQA
jgi:hypothetical protein